ncbi:hypothetical protein MY4824_007212 [Beauveria thailandica]
MTLDFNSNGGGDALLALNFHPHNHNQQHRQQHHQRQHHAQLQAHAHAHAHAHVQAQPHPTAQIYGYTASNSHPASTAAAAAAFIQHPRIWPIPIDMASSSSPPVAASSSPEDSHIHSPHSYASSPNSHHSPIQSPPFHHAINALTDWALQQQQQQQQIAATAPHDHRDLGPQIDLSQFIQDPSLINFTGLPPAFATNPMDYLPATTQAAIQQASLLESAFQSMPPMDAATHAMNWGSTGMENWSEFQHNLQMEGLPRMDSVGSNSPTGTYLEVLSLPSSAGDGWAMVDWGHAHHNVEPFSQAQNATAIFNPSQTLHIRADSNSSDGANSLDFSSFEEIHPFPYSPVSPESEGHGDAHHHRNCLSSESHHTHSHGSVSPKAVTAAVPIKTEPSVVVKTEPSTRHSPGSGAGATTPPSASASSSRRNSGPRKSPIAKAPKPVVRRISTGKKDGTGEKKVGRRKGPLRPDQRKQASEIRKLRACLRCKFLKKTCDKGEPCGGCQPSHARLWQVPCTRIDIKDIGYFMKDWKADHESHMTSGLSIYSVKGFAPKESLMWITHGYGFALPIMVREVYVTDDSSLSVEWREAPSVNEGSYDFEIRCERLDVGAEGVNSAALSEYLDKHIEGPFEDFIDDHFDGTPFITEILKTAHRYYAKEKMPVIGKALKLVLAYNLTMHITMVENQGSEVQLDSQIENAESRYYGRTVAPVMVNFQIKYALAEMWRELQKDILEELSSLYSGVYSGEKMKNWPTIFMLASILLAVWEEMQFDCHYRVPDPAAVNKFCTDMETTPVGVIVGLFHAISQKLPAFTEWNTAQHGQLLHNNVSVCEAMTEVRESVVKHEAYLRARKEEASFDPTDFDSLSNKFLSKLVIKAN